MSEVLSQFAKDTDMDQLKSAYDINGACAARLKDFPLYSQEKSRDPLVGVKLFHAFGAGTWYLTEYDQEEQLAFGYVTGLAFDEWGYVSLIEMADITFHGVPSIEVDVFFSPRPMSTIAECCRSGALRRDTSDDGGD